MVTSDEGERAEIEIAEYVATMLEERPAILDNATDEELGVIVRALSAIAALGSDVPEGLQREIRQISIDGVDPAWQITELRKLLERWAPRQ